MVRYMAEKRYPHEISFDSLFSLSPRATPPNLEGLIPVAINPRLSEVSKLDWPIKVFYSLMRELKAHHADWAKNLLDAGSTVEPRSQDESMKIRDLVRCANNKAIDAGDYEAYPSSWGLPGLRKAIRAFSHRHACSLPCEKTEVMVTGGIIKGVDALIQGLNIDTVIVPSLAPYFVRSLAILRGKGVQNVELNHATGNFDLGRLERELRIEPSGAALFYMTLPASPSGTLPTEDHIEKELIPFAQRLGIPIVSDTYVLATTFANRPIRCFMSYPDAWKTGVELIGVAKENGLPGLRIGGAVGHAEMINAMRKYASCALDMLSTPNQLVAAAALNGIDPYRVGADIRSELVEQTVPRLDAMQWPHTMPQAGFDMIVKVPPGFSSCDDPSLAASLSLVMKYGVAFSPASVFGPHGRDHLRIVLKQKRGKIPDALDRMREYGFSWKTEQPDNDFDKRLRELLDRIDLTAL